MACMADYTEEELRLMQSIRDEIASKLEELKFSSPTDRIMRLKLTLLIKELRKSSKPKKSDNNNLIKDSSFKDILKKKNYLMRLCNDKTFRRNEKKRLGILH